MWLVAAGVLLINLRSLILPSESKGSTSWKERLLQTTTN